jgi:hypothetical protein
MASVEEADSGPTADAEQSQSSPERTPPSPERTRPGGVSALAAAVALIVVADEHWLVAVVGALALLTAWYLAAPPYAFAVGNLALVAALPEADLVRVGVVEVGLLGVLLASATTPDGHDRFSSLTVVGALLVLGWILIGGALAWASTRSLLDLRVAAVLLVVPTALAAYGLHRYELVELGVIGETHEQ